MVSRVAPETKEPLGFLAVSVLFRCSRTVAKLHLQTAALPLGYEAQSLLFLAILRFLAFCTSGLYYRLYYR